MTDAINTAHPMLALTTRPAALSIERLRLTVGQGALQKVLVDDLSLSVARGQCVALVGESGSGKSLSALACARLLPDAIGIAGGDVWLGGDGHFAGSQPNEAAASAASISSINVFDLPRSALASVRGRRIGFVFQEPSLALNPVLTIGEQLVEALALHSELPSAALRDAAASALAEVGIPHAAARLNDFPMQFSGGQKQRIMIAMALAGQPDVLIADEPTTALDVLVQAQVLALLTALKRSRGMALLLITHDLAIVKQMADEVVVMQAGKVVEHASATQFFAAPQHPHSQALLSANRGQVLCAADVCAAAAGATAPLLVLSQLSAAYNTHSSLWRRPALTKVLHGIDLSIAGGQTLALVGASGSGKTTLAKVVLGLQDRNMRCSGTLCLDSHTKPAASTPDRNWQQVVSVVFQDPFASLNPRMRAGDIVMEGVRQLRPEWSGAQAQARIADLIHAVDLPVDSLLRWPHEFSGGQRQRLAIVRALAVAPKLVVLDEPTSALDVTVQAKLLALLVDLQQQFGYSYLLITHNFQVVQAMAQHVAVLHGGAVVEYGLTETVLHRPQHDMTRQLLAAVPKL
jgi:peptide/nickel transport system ATP-binding protein